MMTMLLLWVAVEVGAAVAGAEVCSRGPELSLGGMSQTLGWPEGGGSYGDKFDRASAESRGRRRLHDTLQSARLEHGDPGG